MIKSTRFFCQLHLPHLQLDELRTRLRCAKQVLWLWLAIDPLTKILPVLQLGPRSQTMAHLEWWRAYYLFVRPHASLRIALVQPRERGGKLVAQRYRLRTEALAAGRTTRRGTAREVLSCPLPKVSA